MRSAGGDKKCMDYCRVADFCNYAKERVTVDNLELWEKFKAVPAAAKKEISGGRLKGMTDINPTWRQKILTEQFGPCGFGWT